MSLKILYQLVEISQLQMASFLSHLKHQETLDIHDQLGIGCCQVIWRYDLE
jgi:hypothetical protein